MLYNILLLFFVFIPSINISLRAPPKKRDAESTTTFKALYRRQMGPQMMTRPGMGPAMAQDSKSKAKLESYYEPYWEKGDWVYYRGESTQRAHPFYLNVGNTTQHDECNQLCTDFFKNYGTVCAMKYNNYYGKYDIRTFENYCYLELENCFNFNRTWFAVHKGNCTDFVTQPFAHLQFVTRASKYEEDIFGTT